VPSAAENTRGACVLAIELRLITNHDSRIGMIRGVGVPSHRNS
jgi:hypothetical protein